MSAVTVVGAAAASAGGDAFDFDGTSVSDLENGQDALAAINIATDGTASITGNFGGSASQWWAVNPLTGIGTGKYVRFRKTSGDSLNGASAAEDTWHEITTTRIFSINTAGTPSSGKSWVGVAEFSLDGSTVAHASSSITLSANRIL